MKFLQIVHDGRGGTPETTWDLAKGWRDGEAFVLSSNGRSVKLHEANRSGEGRLIQAFEVTKPGDYSYALDSPFSRILDEVLANHDFDVVHIRHLAKQSLEMARTVAFHRVPLVLSIHDFFYVCPTVNLVDADGMFCGGVCSKGAADCKPKLGIKPKSRLRDGWVLDWRRETRQVVSLADADAVVVTTQSVWAITQRALQVYPPPPVHVIPHGRDIPTSIATGKAPGKLKVAALGNFGSEKGLHVLLEACRVLSLEKFEFHLLGEVNPGQPLPPNCHHHGTYQRGDAGVLLKKIRPHVGVIPSVMYETHSHVLTELWAAGLPVVASRLGALQERIEVSGAGVLFEPGDAMGLAGLLDDLRTNHAWREQITDRARSVPITTVGEMVTRYRELYRGLVRMKRG